MNPVLLAVLAGAFLAWVAGSEKDRSVSTVNAELADVRRKLTEAEANQASKAELDALRSERDELTREVATLKAGQEARNQPAPKPADPPAPEPQS